MTHDVHLKAVACVLAGGLAALAALGSQESLASTTTALARPATSSPAASSHGPASSTLTLTARAPGSCGGEQTLTADGVSWTCTFDAEFTGSSYDPDQWQPITTAASGYASGPTACFVDDPANISVADGYLQLSAIEAPAPFWCQDQSLGFETLYTSGDLSTYGRFSQTYGRFEIRARVPSTSAPGLQSSLWLYPQSLAGAGPEAGEIDIAEVYSDDPYIAVPTAHYSPDSDKDPLTGTNIQTSYTCLIDVGQWNDYVLEWAPGTLKFIYNGQTCLVDHYAESSGTGAEPFDQPFFINLTQALGMLPNAFLPGITPLPATTDIQYVRVWQAQSITGAEQALSGS